MKTIIFRMPKYIRFKDGTYMTINRNITMPAEEWEKFTEKERREIYQEGEI